MAVVGDVAGRGDDRLAALHLRLRQPAAERGAARIGEEGGEVESGHSDTLRRAAGRSADARS